MSIKVMSIARKNLVSQAIFEHLFKEKEFDLLPFVENLDDFFELYPANMPEVVMITGIRSGTVVLSLVKKYLKAYPAVNIVVVMGYSNRDQMLDLLHEGVKGFISQYESDFEGLTQALKAAAESRTYVCAANLPQYANAYPDDSLNDADASLISTLPHGMLSDREAVILGAIATGYTSKEIGRQLNIAPTTVDVHRKNIMRKLELKNVVELTRYAIRHNISAV